MSCLRCDAEEFPWAFGPPELMKVGVILRACDFFGFLATFGHLTPLLSVALFGDFQKSHTL